MKVSIGSKIKQGPWGGGNLFVINLKNYLLSQGHDVVHTLKDKDIDLILMTEPRRKSESSAFTHFDIKNYLEFINPNAIVVHRINECDERKDTNYVNKYLSNANKIADGTVFVSTWIKDLYKEVGIDLKNSKVILSGSDKKIFNDINGTNWDKKSELKIVTHHWGDNWKKGFDTYNILDEIVKNDFYGYDLSFTYIGKIPKNYKFINSNYITPLSGNELADEIKKHHIYVTGSLNEPSGNHHIEGAQCGLPLLYINSGGIPEYCNGYGVMYDIENFKEKLKEIIINYDVYKNAIKTYKNDSQVMSKEYEEFFFSLMKIKHQLIKEREKSTENKIIYLIKKIIFKIRNSS